ncbi:lipid II:glycine glycyltransferase FemX [Candidatus Contubernalis alkaliaceticus]|uniref:lipid II:glycine glycyltransferase FemX n=1 Tax=Candidatus Contubernalis alkaliaceticus TaxID=338645 RepID=UPI001F4C3C90|nr:peptidoglycan bridge formation glycyltransferase FemA/FemB family protein [Candidatus Contubernalis alkalaceticus]UNC91382.1 peptidoglycan bridge formation glycyltransferase FemA/FemB family protein [Candidatus Contubernalis alkalaceticus]
MTLPLETKLLHDKEHYWMRQVTADEKMDFQRFLENSELGNIFQTFEWAQLKEMGGWQPFHFLLESRGKALGAVSLLKRRAGGLSFFYSPRGPVLDYRNPDVLALFSRGIKPIAQREKAAFWRIDPELPGDFVTDAFQRANFQRVPMTNNFGGIQPKWVWRIPLQKTSGEQWKLLKKSCRRQIKKAEKNGVEVRWGGREHLSEFYGLLQATASRNGFLLRGQKYYENLWRLLYPTGNLLLSMAYLEGEPVSTALAVVFRRGVWDLYAGSSRVGMDSGASYLITWQLISSAVQKGLGFYDLGGIINQAQAEGSLNGLKIFKSRFGGKEIEFLGEYDLVFNSSAYRFWNWGQKGYNFLKRCRIFLQI